MGEKLEMMMACKSAPPPFTLGHVEEEKWEEEWLKKREAAGPSN